MVVDKICTRTKVVKLVGEPLKRVGAALDDTPGAAPAVLKALDEAPLADGDFLGAVEVVERTCRQWKSGRNAPPAGRKDLNEIQSERTKAGLHKAGWDSPPGVAQGWQAGPSRANGSSGPPTTLSGDYRAPSELGTLRRRLAKSAPTNGAVP